MKTTRSIYLALLAVLLSPMVANADPVLSFSGGIQLSGGGTQNIGWQFNVTSAITVTELTWADLEQDGLNYSHEMGIWDSAGNLLVSTTIQAGTGSALDGIWRTEDIADILLAIGDGYIVGGLNTHPSPDLFAANVTALTVNPSVQFVDATFSNISSTFGRPTFFSSAETGFFGPSFNIATSPVPEPGTLALLGLGLVGMAARRRKKA